MMTAPAELVARPKGIEENRGFAYGASHREDDPRQDPRGCRGKHDPKEGLESRGSDGEASLPEGHGNRFQRLLGGPHDRGQDHESHREGAGNEADSETEDPHEEDVAEQAEDDGGDPCQGFRTHTEYRYHLLLPGVLHKEDPRPDPDGNGEEEGEQDQEEGVDDDGGDPAPLARARRRLNQEAEGQVGAPFPSQDVEEGKSLPDRLRVRDHGDSSLNGAQKSDRFLDRDTRRSGRFSLVSRRLRVDPDRNDRDVPAPKFAPVGHSARKDALEIGGGDLAKMRFSSISVTTR